MKIAIIGAGAAGCFCAANINHELGLEVVVFEKTGKVMQKVKVSGGGRCNVTHEYSKGDAFEQNYPRGAQFIKKAIHHFSPLDTVQWFQKAGVTLKTEKDGRMFPNTNDSQTIIDAIWSKVIANGVQVRYNHSLQNIEHIDSRFKLHFDNNSPQIFDKVVITTGGMLAPGKFDWLLKLGHTINKPVPSLFTFNLPRHSITQLMGVAVPEATVKIKGTKISESGPVLITHWGLSGPAVLKCSAFAARTLAENNYNFEFTVNWLGNTTENVLREELNSMRSGFGKSLVFNKNPFTLSKRFWEYLLLTCGVKEEAKWGELPSTAQNKLIENLIRMPFKAQGKTTFKEEFVTCGGVSLNEIQHQSMESKIVPGLYFAGETLDVDGITGGYNFQHAWCSAFIAASHINQLN